MESKHLMREVLVTALIMAGMMIYSHWTSAQPNVPVVTTAPAGTAQTAAATPAQPILPGQDVTIINNLPNYDVKIGYTTPANIATDTTITYPNKITIRVAPAPNDKLLVRIQTPDGHIGSREPKMINASATVDINQSAVGDLIKKLEEELTPPKPEIKK